MTLEDDTNIIIAHFDKGYCTLVTYDQECKLP